LARLATYLLALGLACCGSPAHAGKDFDKRKAERLAEHRAKRRAIEREYESCLRRPGGVEAKCLLEIEKALPKILASLNQPR
jgi:hypothetical protein